MSIFYNMLKQKAGDPKYKDEIVSKVYKVAFNNGKFSNEELYKSIKMSDDKYFKDDVLAACK